MRYILLVFILCSSFSIRLSFASDDLAHESFHKAKSENPFLNNHIGANQEECIAQRIGRHARAMAEVYKDEEKIDRVQDGYKHMECK